jgi:hypothetical protein
MRRGLVLAGLLVGGPACREAAPTTTPGPTQHPAPATPAEAHPPQPRGPQELVVVVDGVELREADVARLVRVASTSPEPPPPRAALVLQLVERQLVIGEAARLRVEIGADDVDRGLANIGTSFGFTVEQLRAAVVDTTAMSWEEYREEVAAQLLEMKLIMMMPGTGASEWGESSADADRRLSTTRARMVGCLRARAEVVVKDESITLPDNPFAIAATLAALRFTGDPVLPAVELEAAAKAVASGQPLCDSLAAAEAAMTQLYVDRGYLEGRVHIPWPERPGAMTLTVEAVPGPRYVVGELVFDQSAAPKGKRVDEKALRRALARLAKPGDVADRTRLQGITELVQTTFRAAAVGPVTMDVARVPAGDGVRLDLTFRVTKEAG